MGTTLKNMKDNLENRGVNDSFRAYFTEWINQAYDIMWNYYPWEIKVADAVSMSVVDGTSEYTISSAIASDVADILYMYDTTNNKKIEYIALSEILETDPDLSRSGTPQAFTYINKRTEVKLWPEPDATYTMKVVYTVTKTDLTEDTDEPLFLERHRRILQDGAYALALAYDGDARAGAAWNMFMYSSPFYKRGMKVPGGLVGMSIEEDRNKSLNGSSLDPETGMIT